MSFRLSTTTSLEEKSQIVESLKFFIYFPEGLSVVCHRSEITDICIKSMNYFLDNSDNEHKFEESDYYGVEDQLENIVRSDSTALRSIEFLDKVCFILSRGQKMNFEQNIYIRNTQI